MIKHILSEVFKKITCCLVVSYNEYDFIFIFQSESLSSLNGLIMRIFCVANRLFRTQRLSDKTTWK